jgi:hypothetical protein
VPDKSKDKQENMAEKVGEVTNSTADHNLNPHHSHSHGHSTTTDDDSDNNGADDADDADDDVAVAVAVNEVTGFDTPESQEI